VNFRGEFGIKYQFHLLRVYVTAYKWNIQSFKTNAVILNGNVYYNIALATLIPHVALVQQNFRKSFEIFCCCSRCLLSDYFHGTCDVCLKFFNL
jgi:hypothetical protein